MKVNIYSLKGKVTKKIELPSTFGKPIRPDLIKRAVIAAQSARLQPYGSDRLSGKRTSAYSWGAGRGVSRVPRVKGSRHHASGKAAFVPQAVGGRRAHPPKVEKKIKKKINVKERKKAIASAIAATAVKDLVEKRGHRIEKVKELPIVVSDDLEKVKKTKDAKEIFIKLGVWEDILRAKVRKIRAGKGTKRGRKYRRKKSMLIVVSEDRGIKMAAKNHNGVDVVKASNLGVEDLAPGTHYGRLTLYTKSAIEKIEERFSK